MSARQRQRIWAPWQHRPHCTLTPLARPPTSPLRIGTRGSPLALAQAHETRDRLMAACDLPEEAFEVVVIKVTRATGVQDRALKEIGGKGLFTREIEEALLSARIDIAVHSMKDMPALQPEGLVLDCLLPREDVRDAFVSPHHGGDRRSARGRGGRHLQPASPGAAAARAGRTCTWWSSAATCRPGCASWTRAWRWRPSWRWRGCNRLGLAGRIPAAPVDPDEMLPAVAQGAIGIERPRRRPRHGGAARGDPRRPDGRAAGGRAGVPAALDGSCQTPIAGLAELDGGTLRLRGEILRPDGSEALADDATGAMEDGPEMGTEMAKRLLARAGDGFFAE